MTAGIRGDVRRAAPSRRKKKGLRRGIEGSREAAGCSPGAVDRQKRAHRGHERAGFGREHLRGGRAAPCRCAPQHPTPPPSHPPPIPHHPPGRRSHRGNLLHAGGDKPLGLLRRCRAGPGCARARGEGRTRWPVRPRPRRQGSGATPSRTVRKAAGRGCLASIRPSSSTMLTPAQQCDPPAAQPLDRLATRSTPGRGAGLVRRTAGGRRGGTRTSLTPGDRMVGRRFGR